MAILERVHPFKIIQLYFLLSIVYCNNIRGLNFETNKQLHDTQIGYSPQITLLFDPELLNNPQFFNLFTLNFEQNTQTQTEFQYKTIDCTNISKKIPEFGTFLYISYSILTSTDLKFYKCSIIKEKLFGVIIVDLTKLKLGSFENLLNIIGDLFDIHINKEIKEFEICENGYFNVKNEICEYNRYRKSDEDLYSMYYEIIGNTNDIPIGVTYMGSNLNITENFFSFLVIQLKEYAFGSETMEAHYQSSSEYLLIHSAVLVLFESSISKDNNTVDLLYSICEAAYMVDDPEEYIKDFYESYNLAAYYYLDYYSNLDRLSSNYTEKLIYVNKNLNSFYVKISQGGKFPAGISLYVSSLTDELFVRISTKLSVNIGDSIDCQCDFCNETKIVITIINEYIQFGPQSDVISFAAYLSGESGEYIDSYMENAVLGNSSELCMNKSFNVNVYDNSGIDWICGPYGNHCENNTIVSTEDNNSVNFIGSQFGIYILQQKCYSGEALSNINYTCQNCSDTCIECSDLYSCTICNSNLSFLIGPGLGLCGNCTEEIFPSNNTCVYCPTGSTYNSTTYECLCPNNTFYTLNSCVSCIDNQFYNYSSNQCECIKGYDLQNDTCTICERWLQYYEIKGEIANYLKDLIISFSISVTFLPCQNLFPNETLLKLGIGFICEFSSDYTLLTIKLGLGSNLTNERIYLNPQVLKGQNKECGFMPYDLYIDLVYIDPLPMPIAIILAPEYVFFECQNLTIDGLLSSGGYEKDLLFKWKVDSDIQNLPSFSIDYSNISTVFIESTKLDEGIISVELSVKNWFGKEHTTIVQIGSVKNTFLLVEFDKTIEYACKLNTTCQFMIFKISSCISNPIYSYNWEFLKGSESLTNDQLNEFWSKQSPSSLIKIPARTFPPSSLLFSVNVTEKNTKLQGSNTLNITIEPENPVLILDKASGSVSTLVDTFINSSKSFDPNGENSITFDWFCSYSVSECNFYYEKTFDGFTIPKDIAEIKALDFLNLTIYIKKIIQRNLLDEITLSISTIYIPLFVNWIVPNVTIFEYFTGYQPKIVSSKNPFSLKAEVQNNPDDYNPLWSIENIDGVFLSPVNSYIICINIPSLFQNQEYTVKLSLISSDYHESVFTYTFKVNASPISGNLLVVPDSGTELSTIFTFFARDWIDYDENYPLFYKFGIFVNSERVVLVPLSQIPYASLTISYTSSVVMCFVTVLDALGDDNDAFFNIQLKLDENFSPSQYMLNVADTIEDLLPNQVPLAVFNLAAGVINRELTLTGNFTQPDNLKLQAMIECFNLSLEYIQKSSEDFIPSSSNLEQSLSLLQVLTLNPYLQSETNFNTTTQTIEKILQETKEIGLKPDQAAQVLSTITNSININIETIYNNTGGLNSLSSLLNSVSEGLLKNLAVGQVASCVIGQISIDATVIDQAQAKNLSFASSGSSANTQFPEGFLDNLIGNPIEGNLGLSLIHIDSDVSAYNSTPTIVGLTLFSMENISPIEVKLKNSYIKIKIPVYNALTAYSPECFYLDPITSTWKTQGCKKTEVHEDYIICSCNHLTFLSAGEGMTGGGFVPKSNIGDTIDFKALENINASNAAGFYFAGVILAFYIPIAIIAIKKDKRDLNEFIKSLDGEQNNNENPPVAQVSDRSKGLSDREKDQGSTARSSNNPKDLKDKRDSVIVENTFIQGPRQERDESLDEIQIRVYKKEEQKSTGLRLVLEKHKILTIFFLYDPQQSRITRCTMLFFTFIGQMFFIGLFYDGAKSTSDNFWDKILSYSLRDFMVMIYSSILMVVIQNIANYFLKERIIDKTKTKEEILKQIKRNKIMKIIGLAFCWTGMAYFLWSIAMFALKFPQGISHMWLFNTGISFMTDICVTSFINAFIYAYVISRVLIFIAKWRENKQRERQESFDSEDLHDRA
ncbi:hypothetical protein SteCoe_37447 [Stentor coeruleus]|uniref:PKD/REJ-like domain-containing protein n=1 Tax=Stentor coeruleus TaxID=5963 RepID=A0A1R2AMZ1_9CILI|nr:hypothetical protein SteCoe_37447 [Stentor coeruleus]